MLIATLTSIKCSRRKELEYIIPFYGLAVKTGSIALQVVFLGVFCGKKFVIWGQNIFFQIRLKKQMGHPGLLFLIFWQVLE